MSDPLDMEDRRVVPCEACGSEGRRYSGHPNDPNPRDEGPCPVCDGTGSEIVEVSPIEIGDVGSCAVCGATPFLFPCHDQSCPHATANHKRSAS